MLARSHPLYYSCKGRCPHKVCEAFTHLLPEELMKAEDLACPQAIIPDSSPNVFLPFVWVAQLGMSHLQLQGTTPLVKWESNASLLPRPPTSFSTLRTTSQPANLWIPVNAVL